VIHVPRERVFGLVADPLTAEQFFEGIFDIHQVGEKTQGDGIQVACKVVTLEIGHIGYVAEYSEFVVNVGWTSRSIKGPQFVEHWHFETSEKHPDATQVSYEMSYHVPIPLIGRFIEQKLSRPIWEERIERSF
jgi:hypothetical protein